MPWQQWKQQGWNSDGKTDATDNVVATAMAAVWASIGGDGGNIRLEQRRRNSGNRQGGSDRYGGDAMRVKHRQCSDGNMKDRSDRNGGDGDAVATMAAARLEQRRQNGRDR